MLMFGIYDQAANEKELIVYFTFIRNNVLIGFGDSAIFSLVDCICAMKIETKFDQINKSAVESVDSISNDMLEILHHLTFLEFCS